MATLERIRSKGGILVAIFIGFALFAFIMMDFMGSGDAMFQRGQTELANINGTSIDIQDFQRRVSEIEEFTKLNRGVNSLSAEEVNSIRDQAWEELVITTLLKERYEQLGIEVTSAELMDMVTGNNIHPSIRQHPLFMNQQTGSFDPQQVVNFLMAKDQDPTANFYWSVMEKQLLQEQHRVKYDNILRWGMYIPSLWQEKEIKSRTRVTDFDYLRARTLTISDDEVSLTDREIENYYNNNKDRFKQEASRAIEYVRFQVTPTDEDIKRAEDWIKDMIDDFSHPETDAEQFVNLNSDEPFSGRYHRPQEFSSQIEDFVLTSSPGDVYGPYREDESFKAARLVDVSQIPDSVRASHILIQEPTQQQSHQLADSLISIINAGESFADLARDYSMDQGSAINGGDLGWFREGMMVEPFSNAAFTSNIGDVVKTETEYGIHIIYVQNQSRPVTKYQVATLAREITYSSQTYQNVYSKATRFAANSQTADNFASTAEEEGYNIRSASNIGINDRSVGNIENSRELVRWVYEAEPGEMSQVLEFEDQFVVANLVSKTEKGVEPLSNVRAQIESVLLREKKADLLAERLKEFKDEGLNLTEIATKVEGDISFAEEISFETRQIPGAGIEPGLSGLAAHSPLNQIAGPVKGNNGVYLIQVTNEYDKEVDENSLRQEFMQLISTKTNQQLPEWIKDKAEIEDKRFNFY
ncbi:SurA N-terminal domain-containing protein [Marinilabiliaceae bacterium ANBcel2]|nr:SurA N-terminal domain-containing protein [Marinilabiliaceae bacterium ANBcel2]